MMGDRLVSVPTTKKPCYLSQTAGLHRFLILLITFYLYSFVDLFIIRNRLGRKIFA